MNGSEHQNQRRTEFFARLERLSAGDRTALKRSLGVSFAEAGAAARAAYLTAHPSYAPWEEEPYFLAACAWCAFQNIGGPERSFAGCLRILAGEHTGVRRRFLALLDMPWDDSGYFAGKISRLLRMIRQKGIQPDMDLLLKDLLGWGQESHFVQINWSKEFFGAAVPDQKKEE